MTTPGSHGPGEQSPSGGSGWGPPPSPPQQPGAVPPAAGSSPPSPGAVPPGQYPPPQGAVPPGLGWVPQPQPKSGAGKWIGIVGGVIAVLLVVVAVFAFLGGGDPEVGDCLQEDGQELLVVDCDDSDAAWRLLGIQQGEQSYDEYLADPETCSAFPEAVQSFWIGENGDESGQGQVYCVTSA